VDRRRIAALIFAALLPALPARADDAPPSDPTAGVRRAMVEEIERIARFGPRRISEPVLAAVRKVARHELVPEELRASAYLDTPLPIGNGQTISQPYIVALMSELASVAPGEKVLEVGTGSGYQAAVLAELGAKVFTIEIVEPLGRLAEQRLEALGYGDRIQVRIGDGYKGWAEHAPFDAVVVTAAPDEIPPPLLEQLAPGGVLVIPVGTQTFGQQLTVVEKSADGKTTTREVLPVRFVPLTREK
jgi:protein-L-isoaspartate(D-aspartate) O-methyltransferase